MAGTDPKTLQDLTSVTMSNQIIRRIDDMSSRIDNLEKKHCRLHDPGWGGRAGGGEQDPCHTKEPKAAKSH
ncbi:unnamed protein product [Nyctereutes procyonoides]|uniref:(raccoon dog) hypothetical protein n=1 Tax=Nyctereutes procyonoides TaxID=34880 RepID=A0A811YIN9_NYCPR|nr:unnamed protein product [Nyctereutes procyonoides]